MTKQSGFGQELICIKEVPLNKSFSGILIVMHFCHLEASIWLIGFKVKIWFQVSQLYFIWKSVSNGVNFKKGVTNSANLAGLPTAQ